MPGRHLSNNERRLLDFWEAPPVNMTRPLLRSVEIAGGNGLRGLDGVLVPFRYPITAICGKNGSGKSTVLALAALAHHSPAGWHVHWTNTRYRRSRATEDRSYYMFPDFFFYGHNEPTPNDVRITWRYQFQGAETTVEFRKTEKQWGHYSRRPEREVDYAPLSRILPAQELNAVRGAFSSDNPQAVRQTFDEQYRGYFSYIMGENYNEAHVLKTDRLLFSICQTNVNYSGFNMGGGESCVAHLLHLLGRLPPFGLLVIEEIESCLHPEAQVRLAEILVDICNRKKLQVVCSTHSEIFLDALPRQARLLLRKNDDSNPVIESPSTRFAIYEMKGEVQPELTLYCEDRAAAMMIEEAIPYEDRRRLRVVDVGSDATVIRQGVSHLRGDFPGGCLCVPDGDTTQVQIDGWIQSETNGNADIAPVVEALPGDNLPPERWALEQLALEDYRNEFADQLGCDRAEATNHADAMRVDIDHHDIAHTLGRRTGLNANDCLRRIMRSVAPRHPALDAVRLRVADLLN